MTASSRLNMDSKEMENGRKYAAKGTHFGRDAGSDSQGRGPCAAVSQRRAAAQAGAGAEAHLPGGERREGRGAAGRVRGQRPREPVSGRGALLAWPLGPGDSLPGVLAHDPQVDLHHQRHREPERHGSPGGAVPRALHERGSREEAGLPGAARGQRQVEGADAPLAGGQARVRHPLRGTVQPLEGMDHKGVGKSGRIGKSENFLPLGGELERGKYTEFLTLLFCCRHCVSFDVA